MEIKRKAKAGTMQSSDLMVFVEPFHELKIEIESTVKKQFEDLIRERVMDVLKRLNVEKGYFKISDRGALDYSIEARVETAVRRGAE
ncbi:citrate lyase acyl carrier protein [Deferribacter autotrophicus]|uniref:Citrate lyase acyl carrier protein n=1 Tax=Deferribacter autotrophicus TaxID=500465 RepID=A0A5A8F179_9BACT|nr:citrate lyase acyl carrier protein [Deferribacter autotrophicus]KAA0257131.1 citrate lyase acyl carrier protein [Deferribacter autotrophicus]